MDPRIRTAIGLYAFTVFGIFLVVVPWSALWDQALIGIVPESFRAIADSGWARGSVSGLGALDLLAALQLLREKGTDLFFKEK